MSKLDLEKLIYRAATDLTHAEFRVLVVLMTYTDKDGRNAHPANVRLAEETGIPKANITRSLKSLETKGYIVKTEQGGNRQGMRRANVYRVQAPAQVIHKGVNTTTSETVPDGSPVENRADLSSKGVVTTTKGVVTTTTSCCDDTPSGPLSGPRSDPEFHDQFHAQRQAQRTREVSSNPSIRNRTDVLDVIQTVATSPEGNYGEPMEELRSILAENHSDALADFLEYGWTVPAKCEDRYEAGVWLNKLLNTAAAQEGVTIAPEPWATRAPGSVPVQADDDFTAAPEEDLGPVDEEAERNRQLALLRAKYPDFAA